MVLSEVSRGDVVQVTSVDADAAVARRLALLGVRTGARLTVGPSTCGAALRVELASGQVALAGSLLSSVTVERCHGGV